MLELTAAAAGARIVATDRRHRWLVSRVSVRRFRPASLRRGARPSRVASPARAASSRFARHQRATHASRPRNRKYLRAKSPWISDSRPRSIAFSRYCGMPKATETSRMLRRPRASRQRAPRGCQRIVSPHRARALAGRPGNDAAMIRRSSPVKTPTSAALRIALGRCVGRLAAAVASSARPAARARSRVREVRSRSIFTDAGDVYRVLSSCVSWCTR